MCGCCRRAAEPDLAKEPLGAQHLSQIRMQDLERDGPVVPEVVGQKHRGHAAASELALDPVPIGQGRLQAIQLIGHEYLADVMADAMANDSTSGCLPLVVVRHHRRRLA